MMTDIRRSPYAFFYLEDDYVLDISSLLRGEQPASSSEARILALAILTGQRHVLSREELDILLSVPAERWIDAADRDPEILRSLLDRGLLLSKGGNARLKTLRERDEALSANAWNLYAALYHFMTQWSGVDISQGKNDRELAELSSSAAEALVAEHGRPPAAFADRRPGRTVTLPAEDRNMPLYRTLTARRTTRTFDTEAQMTLGQLNTVLRYVFGSHGYASAAGDCVCIKRTSPSGGGLHPVEAYPIVTNVADVPTGIYHYSVRDHALVLLVELEPSQARLTAGSFMCGQEYFGAAHVSFILTARFYRSHWKYRNHHKAYAGMLMDAAHLTQTMYLVSAELGLGAFVTIAVNAIDIEEYMSFDGISEGVLAMAGCGVRAAGESPLDLQFSPHPLR